jgi:hypothetical protein
MDIGAAIAFEAKGCQYQAAEISASDWYMKIAGLL